MSHNQRAALVAATLIGLFLVAAFAPHWVPYL